MWRFPHTWGLLFFLVGALGDGSACAQAPLPRRPIAPPSWMPQYDLAIHLDTADHRVHVHQRVTWTNHHQRPAQEIVFNAHSHYRIRSSELGLTAKTLELLRMNPGDGIFKEEDVLIVHKVCLGETALPFHYAGDTETDLVVSLPVAVAQNQTIVLDLDFTMHLPQKQGRWGQWQGVTFLSNWHPVVAVYDDNGWHPTPFVPWHQPFYNEAGSYKVRIVLPADQKAASSGHIEAERPLPNGLKELTISACGIREFTFLCSARYVEYVAEAANAPGMPPVHLHCLAFPEHEHYARQILRISSEVLPYYCSWIGPYPYPDLTYVESYFGWNGNECSTLVMIDERVFAMPHAGKGYVEYLITHETCHQWWYNLIGTNGYCETWMDEAWATFFAHRFLNRTRGFNNKMLDFPPELDWLPNIRRETYRNSGVTGTIGRNEGTPIIQELPKFGHIATLFSMCYDKGSKIVGMIEDRLGETAFEDFMHRIYDRYAYRIIRVADFQHELEEYTGRSWEKFFKEWLYGAGFCDWCVEKVKIEPLPNPNQPRPGSRSFLAALHPEENQPCRVTVLLSQKAEYDEQTTLGFCLKDDAKAERTPFQVRIPILPGLGPMEYPDPPARVESLPNHRIRVEIVLPCRPVQIAVDPDGLLPDRDPSNNYWKPRINWRFSPIYTLLDENDLTTAYDRWNVIFGPYLTAAAYTDPWYTRSTLLGGRMGLYRSQEFSGGVYAGYRTDYQDLVVGVDGLWDHWPWPHTQVGFNAETSLTSISSSDPHPSRAVLFGRYVFMYDSSLYLPPAHYLEAYATAQENFLPQEVHCVPGAQRFNNMVVGGLNYHINYLTPYWDPQGGFQFDLTYNGGEVDLDKHLGLHQLIGQFSTVKNLPDLSGHLNANAWPGRVVEPILGWLADTRLAVRFYGAGGVPDKGEYFSLGGDTMFRGFSLEERQGSVVWLGSAEWRVPLAQRMSWDCVDHVARVQNIYRGAVLRRGRRLRERSFLRSGGPRCRCRPAPGRHLVRFRRTKHVPLRCGSCH